MKRLVVTKKQLNEFIEIKKAEKIYYDILENIHNNMKFLNENISLKKANLSVIENFQRKGQITPRVYEMLIKHNIINDKYEII